MSVPTKNPGVNAYLLPPFRDVVFIAFFVIAAWHGPELFNKDGDLGRHITIGQYILDTRTIPIRDLFSHTRAGERLVPHEWLADVMFGAAFKLMGLGGDVLLTALLIAITFFLVHEEILRRGVFRLIAVLVALWAGMASELHWLARPHVFTFLLLACWAYGLERSVSEKTKPTWHFPLIMLLWANTHGAFIAGFVVWGVYFFEWAWNYSNGRALKEIGFKLGVVGASSFAVTFINPSTWHLWATSIGYIGDKYLVDVTQEYLPPNFHDHTTWPFLFMLVVALWSLSWGAELKLRKSMLLAGWAFLSLYSARNIPLFAIVCAPVIGELLQGQAEKWPGLVRQDGDLQLRGYLWPVVVIICIGFMFSRNIPIDAGRLGNRYDPKVFPVEATSWLQEHPQEGRMFNYFTWGGYLLYKMWPEQKVFIDGQTDFYGEALTREYNQVNGVNDGWEEVLARYGIEWAIIPEDGHLGTHLIQTGRWKVIYKDQTAIILRTAPELQEAVSVTARR